MATEESKTNDLTQEYPRKAYKWMAPGGDDFGLVFLKSMAAGGEEDFICIYEDAYGMTTMDVLNENKIINKVGTAEYLKLKEYLNKWP